MGCISSKIIARSLSYHEERMQGSRRSANDIPLLEDIIKLHSRSFSSNKSPKQAIESACSEHIEKLEIPSKEEQAVRKQGEGDEKSRSKSWHWFPDYIVSSIAEESLFDSDEQHDLSSKGKTRSRSFHTVEDYDDMVNRIWLSNCHSVDQCESNDEVSVTNMELKASEDKDSAIKKVQPLCIHKKYSFQESKRVKEKSILSTESESSLVISRIPSQKTNISTLEKGNKRKDLAKRLESLRVQSNVESPAIARLREWLPSGGIYSPGSYVTPKFGSYSLMDIKNASESGESDESIFSPELVSAFEQCMQQLNADEESILKQIMEGVEEE